MKPRIPTLPALILSLVLAAPSGAGTGTGPWIIHIHDTGIRSRQVLGDHFDHVGIARDGQYLYVQADDASDLAYLERRGLAFTVNEQRTAEVRRVSELISRTPGGLSAIPGFQCYRTVAETLADAEQLANDHPELATWIDIGDSWEKTDNPDNGFDIQVLHLTSDRVAGPKPSLMVVGSIHPREYVTAETVTRFAEHMLTGYGVDADATWILDHHELHLVLIANPDGRVEAEMGLSWRKNANNNFCSNSNDRGIDLNRNFDFQWGCCGGSSTEPCSLSFRGPSAGSEPESTALQAYMEAVFPDQRPDDLVTPAPDDSEGIFVDVHSYGEVVLTSWGFTNQAPPNADQIMTLARKYAFFTGYFANLGSLGTVDGATKDQAYGHLGVPSFTAELGTTFFQDCASYESTIYPDNLASLIEMARHARRPYQTPAGPDVYGLNVTSGAVVGDPVLIEATVDDTRYSSAAEPVHSISGAAAYLDLPPWAGGIPLAMTASDGSYDETTETVELLLDTGLLAPGRHLVFMQGEDSAGNVGAPGAVFLDVEQTEVIFLDSLED